MKLLFLYEEKDGWTMRDTTLESFTKDVRYWLQKSPGCCHQVQHIYVITDGQVDLIYIKEEMDGETAQYQEEMRVRNERVLLAQLKAKYES